MISVIVIFLLFILAIITLNNKLLNQKRLKMFKSIMKFMEIRVDLDLQGWEAIDIFAHK